MDDPRSNLNHIRVKAQITITPTRTATVEIKVLGLFILDYYRPHIAAMFIGDMFHDPCIDMSDKTMHLGNPFIVQKKDFVFELFKLFSSTVEEKEIIEKGKVCLMNYYLGKQMETSQQRIAKRKKKQNQVFRMKTIKEIVEDVCIDWNAKDRATMINVTGDYIKWRRTEMRALYTVDVMMRHNNLGRGYLISSVCEVMKKYKPCVAASVIADALLRVEKSAQFSMFIFLIRSRYQKKETVDIIQMDCYDLISFQESMQPQKFGCAWKMFPDFQKIWIVLMKYTEDLRRRFCIEAFRIRNRSKKGIMLNASSLFKDFREKMLLNENISCVEKDSTHARRLRKFLEYLCLEILIAFNVNEPNFTLRQHLGVILTKKKGEEEEEEDNSSRKKKRKSKEDQTQLEKEPKRKK